MLPESGLAAVYGPSGGGKSFLVLDMLASVADGCEWFEHRVNRAPVVYLALEGEAGLSQQRASVSAPAWRTCLQGYALHDRAILAACRW